MTEKKNKMAGSDGDAAKKRKILADLHSGMVLLARFSEGMEPAGKESRVPEANGSSRSEDVRRVLKSEPPPSRHRWN